MDALDRHFEQFLRERRYLKNVSTDTIDWYECAWTTFRRTPGIVATEPAQLTQRDLEVFVIALRDRGVRPISCNTWLKALQAFTAWLHARGELGQALRLSPLKVERRIIPTLNSAALRALVGYRARTFPQRRVHALVCALLDTGCRVQEMLSAAVADFDLDDCLITVIGKGDRQRRVPFSIDLRRILYSYRQAGGLQGEPLMFPARSGGSWGQRNALRSFHLLQDRVGLERVGFHRLRHTFATEYLRNGGDVVRLSRTLGHAELSTTMGYVAMLTGDLQRAHAQTSPLAALRRR